MKDFLFQGNLSKKKYFEGWYYKHTINNTSISIIPGISLSNNSHCFIQVIDTFTNKSYYIKFSLNEFEELEDGIKIHNNYFYKDNINLDINTDELILNGQLSYENQVNITTSRLAPTIMGIFYYFNMECNHSIISMNHTLKGALKINKHCINFYDGLGYIEKDYGRSFPKKYVWLQCNNKESSLFLAVANIPISFFFFKGFICVLIVDNKEYRFSTYNFSKVSTKNNTYVIKKGKLKLVITIIPNNSIKLTSPKLGNMNEYIYESLDSNCEVRLYKNNKLIYEAKYTNCGYEKKD